MAKYILLLLLSTPALAKVPLPVKRQNNTIIKQLKQQSSFNARDIVIIHGAVELIKQLEGFTPSLITDFNKKIKIIGYGDRICKLRYGGTARITEEQGEQCLIEVVIPIYLKLKEELPHLRNNEYIALISLVFNVKSFYNSRLLNHNLKLPRSKWNINMIRYEWLDFCHINGQKECATGLVNRRTIEFDKVFVARKK